MGFVLVPFCASHKVCVRIQVPKSKNSISFFVCVCVWGGKA